MTFQDLLQNEADKTGKMIVGVTRNGNTAKFVWDDTENCSMICVGFDDEEIDNLIDLKAHEGVDIQGYNCSIH